MVRCHVAVLEEKTVRLFVRKTKQEDERSRNRCGSAGGAPDTRRKVSSGATAEHVVAMPAEVLGTGTEGGAVRDRKRVAVTLAEQEHLGSPLAEIGL